MSPPVVILPEVVVEIDQQRAWYDARRDGLGDEFESTVWAAIALIQRETRSGHPWGRILRRQATRRFPFFIIYALGPAIVVTGLAHQRSSPLRTKRRALVRRRRAVP
jgi:hypothetical protein